MSDAIIEEIKRLYYETTADTVQRDLARAIELLKQLPDEETRERVSVYMEGMAEMRQEWHGGKRRGATQTGDARTSRPRRS